MLYWAGTLIIVFFSLFSNSSSKHSRRNRLRTSSRCRYLSNKRNSKLFRWQQCNLDKCPKAALGRSLPREVSEGRDKISIWLFRLFYSVFRVLCFSCFSSMVFCRHCISKTYQPMFNNVFFSLSACGSREMRHSYSAVRLR